MVAIVLMRKSQSVQLIYERFLQPIYLAKTYGIRAASAVNLMISPVRTMAIRNRRDTVSFVALRVAANTLRRKETLTQ
ncbi:hypothetical protein SAMN04515620_102139 [Collimonas sp. OK607]|nr:hypothetical protein SAMN04515620_102139 [Collimonas sp. OK607]